MSYTLTDNQLTALGLPVQHPVVLVEMQLGNDFLRLSTGDVVNWDGKVFAPSGVSVSDIKLGKGGVQKCRVEIANEQFSGGKLGF